MQAEVMEDEAVPMAATPLAATGADEAVVETVVTPDDEGNYIISAAAPRGRRAGCRHRGDHRRSQR